MASIRVALFANTYKPIINGIVASMEALRCYLESNGHEVYVIAPRYPGYRDHADFVRRVPSVTLPAKVRFPLPLPVTPGLMRYLADLRPDVFHTHHPFALGVTAARIAHRLQRPVVTTIHTQYEHYLHYYPVPPWILAPLVRRAVARYCNRCQAVTTPGAGMVRVLQGYGVRRPVSVVPNAVDLRRYQSADGDSVRRRHGLGQAHVVALFTGRIAPEKNLCALLEMARVVLTSHPEFRLIVLGDGPDLPRLRSHAERLGIAEAVLFPGAVPHEEVPPYCAAADLFVTASVTEVNPTSIIEAMAAGTPVVAYDSFATREIVQAGEDGVLTAPGPDKLAAAVTALLARRDLLERMAASAARNAARFSLESAGRKMLKVYEEAIRSHRP